MVYYFHKEPKAFTGGQLRLYGLAGADSPDYEEIEPRLDRAVFFPSWFPHEVLPVRCSSDAFADGRFAMSCWVCKTGETRESATSVSEFAEKWYVVQRAVIDGEALAASFTITHWPVPTAEARASATTRSPTLRLSMRDPSLDMLLESVRPRVEAATGRKLWPTYSYLRVYKRGNLLAAHLDRPSCEISMTVNLGMDADEPWPIWIAGPMGIAAVPLDPGDGLIYRGCDCYHWREPFAGNRLAQVFLHYVDQDGPNAEWKFDKRPSLGAAARVTE